jgi:hypothetical protein
METAISWGYFPLYATGAAYSNTNKMPSALVGNADKIAPHRILYSILHHILFYILDLGDLQWQGRPQKF